MGWASASFKINLDFHLIQLHLIPIHIFGLSFRVFLHRTLGKLNLELTFHPSYLRLESVIHCYCYSIVCSFEYLPIAILNKTYPLV